MWETTEGCRMRESIRSRRVIWELRWERGCMQGTTLIVWSHSTSSQSTIQWAAAISVTDKRRTVHFMPARCDVLDGRTNKRLSWCAADARWTGRSAVNAPIKSATLAVQSLDRFQIAAIYLSGYKNSASTDAAAAAAAVTATGSCSSVAVAVAALMALKYDVISVDRQRRCVSWLMKRKIARHAQHRYWSPPSTLMSVSHDKTKQIC